MHKFTNNFIVERKSTNETNYYLLELWSVRSKGEYGSNTFIIDFRYKVSKPEGVLFMGNVSAKNITSAHNQIRRKHFPLTNTTIRLYSSLFHAKRFKSQWGDYSPEVRKN